MVKVLFVCLGNICRSPMAEFVFKDIIKNKGLENNFYIESAATSSYNQENNISIYPEVKEILSKHHIAFTNRLSRQMTKEDYQKYDYILAMEDKNIQNILKIIENDPNQKLFRLLDFTEKPRDIIDPWYYGNFDETYKDIKYGCERFLEYILKEFKNCK